MSEYDEYQLPQQHHQQRLVGGVNVEKPATPEIQDLVDGIKDQIYTKLSEPRDLSDLKAISYREQIVSGTNYYVKVIKVFLVII